MGGCSAMNCSNRSEAGHRMYVFPADITRRKLWVLNLRRDNWTPGRSAAICEVHFESNQFEQNRADGRKKLKPNAVPTLFNVPNPPKRHEPSPRHSFYKRVPPKENVKTVSKTEIEKWERQGFPMDQIPDVNMTEKTQHLNPENNTLKSSNNLSGTCVPSSHSNTEHVLTEHVLTEVEADCIINELKKQNASLKEQLNNKCNMLLALIQEKNDNLKNTIEQHEKILKSFLNDDQISALKSETHSPVREWSPDSIIKALKFRFALGVHGYEYLRCSNYPLPSYRTLCRRLQDLKINFGIFRDLKTPLISKIQNLDRFCVLSIDEMHINDTIAINKNKMKFSGNITLGPSQEKGNQLLVALLRGAMNPWKQVVGCHITGTQTSGVDLKNFVLECIDFAEELGLTVIAMSSDMGGKNRNLWKTLNVCVNKQARINSFEHRGKVVYVIADQGHLLKNLKSLLLDGYITVPEYLKCEENLSTDHVTGSYIKMLWEKEVAQNKEIRLLYHLKREDIYPDNFQKMNVGAAIRMFSLQTVSAIGVAVQLKELPEEALTTAAFIRFVHDWFEIINSKLRKTSITKQNHVQKLEFLMKFITTINDTQFNNNGWKPLNTGLILTTISVCDLSFFLFKHGFEFILTHRFTQDALENVFAQVRRRAGKLPSSVDCLKVMKVISISQFVSDVNRTNYCADSDITLVEHCKELSTAEVKSRPEIVCLDHSYYFDKCSLNSYRLETVPLQEHYPELDLKSLNLIYYIGGSTVNTLIKKCCSACQLLLHDNSNYENNETIKSWKLYKKFLNMGGLKEPSILVLQLLINCELIYQTFRGHIMHNGGLEIVSKILREINIEFSCENEQGCLLKKDIVQHYFVVRNYTVMNFSKFTKKKKTVYGSASKK